MTLKFNRVPEVVEVENVIKLRICLQRLMSYRANRKKTPTKTIQTVATARRVNIDERILTKCFGTDGLGMAREGSI